MKGNIPYSFVYLCLCLLGLVGKGVHANLLDHRQKTVAAGWTQMVFQTNLLYEIEVGIHNLGWGMTAQYTDEEGDDALYDERIAVGCEYELAIYIIALQPYAALTAIDEFLLILVFLVESSQLVAQVNEHLILVHPVGEILELLYHFILQFINCCHYFISFISFTVINL